MPKDAIREAVRVEIGDAAIDGDLHLPEGASGLVIVAHGSWQQPFQRPKPCGRTRA
jgi:hypothetical protein